MKVNVEIPPPTTVKVTLEMTTEEARILREICGKNCTVSRSVFACDSQDHKRSIAIKFLAEIHNAIPL